MTTTTAKRAGRRGSPGQAPAGSGTVEAAMRKDLRIAENNLELLTEQLRAATAGSMSEAGVADLERQIVNDPGWRTFSVLQEREFTPEGMQQLRAVCRLMSLANPLIKRGLSLRAVYVHGQGVEIRARATGKAADSGEQDVHAVVDEFITDPANQRAVFGGQAADELEHALGTDGDVFLALFTRPRSGWVQARSISADEITEVICNPDDKSEPWFYRRQWQRTAYDEHGRTVHEPQDLMYPDVDYRPKSRPSTFAGVKVAWDAPMIQVAVNRPLNWCRGVPDAYAAINWSRAYKEFLEQWAMLMKSLARFAWRLSVEGKQKTQAKAALAAAGASRNVLGDSNDIGGIAITPPGQQPLEAIPKSGATIDAESGRPLAMMVAAALDVPVTMLLADPGQTGARATAETLDWPTELGMKSRRRLWTAVYARIVRYVIAESVRAPRGKLKGAVTRDDVTDRERIVLAGDTDDTVDVVWPDLDDVEAKEVIDAIVAANLTGTMPPELVLRHLLTALGVRDLESILDEMVDDDGVFQWPQTAQPGGQQAADLARAGQDPAAAGAGLMGPDGQPAGTPGESVPAPTDGAAGRQADADFGLFGGNGTDAQAAGSPPAGPGEEPDEPGYDPDFYRFGGTQEARVDQTQEAAGRQGDADFGLFGGTDKAAPPPGEIPPPQGEQPDSEFDPEFFRL